MDSMKRTSDQLRNRLRKEHASGDGFADELRRKFNSIWEKIDKHPFITEIEQGTLPIEKYRIYAIQNYFYATEWMRQFSTIASRSPTIAGTLTFVKWLTSFSYEFDKYVAIIKRFGLTDRELLQVTVDPTIPFPNVRAYVDYVYKICSTGSFGEAVTSLLPCEWTYSTRDIGGLDCAMRIARSLADHYGIDRKTALEYGTYSSQKSHFELLVFFKETISREVESAEDDLKERIRDIFRRSSEYECMFWDSVYEA